MGLLSRLFYISTRQKLPRLRHHYTNGRALDSFDEESHILLEAGLVRDWSGGKQLIKKHRKSSYELFWALSKRAKANWRKRLKNRLIRLFGGLTHDPHRAELKRIAQGIYEYDGTYSRARRIMPRSGSSDKYPRRS